MNKTQNPQNQLTPQGQARYFILEAWAVIVRRVKELDNVDEIAKEWKELADLLGAFRVEALERYYLHANLSGEKSGESECKESSRTGREDQQSGVSQQLQAPNLPAQNFLK